MFTQKSGVNTDYIQLNGKPLVEVAGGVPTYLHADLLGSPKMATDNAGNIKWTEHYDPYGAKLNGVADKVGYTGHAFDAETGLTYAQARFYDAAVGRFMSSDPIGFSGTDPFNFNRYGYANENPYKFNDPTGMATGSHLNPDSAGVVGNGGTINVHDGGGAALGKSPANARKCSRRRVLRQSRQLQEHLVRTGHRAEEVSVPGSWQQGRLSNI